MLHAATQYQAYPRQQEQSGMPSPDVEPLLIAGRRRFYMYQYPHMNSGPHNNWQTVVIAPASCQLHCSTQCIFKELVRENMKLPRQASTHRLVFRPNFKEIRKPQKYQRVHLFLICQPSSVVVLVVSCAALRGNIWPAAMSAGTGCDP